MLNKVVDMKNFTVKAEQDVNVINMLISGETFSVELVINGGCLPVIVDSSGDTSDLLPNWYITYEGAVIHTCNADSTYEKTLERTYDDRYGTQEFNAYVLHLFPNIPNMYTVIELKYNVFLEDIGVIHDACMEVY